MSRCKQLCILIGLLITFNSSSHMEGYHLGAKQVCSLHIHPEESGPTTGEGANDMEINEWLQKVFDITNHCEYWDLECHYYSLSVEPEDFQFSGEDENLCSFKQFSVTQITDSCELHAYEFGYYYENFLDDCLTGTLDNQL